MSRESSQRLALAVREESPAGKEAIAVSQRVIVTYQFCTPNYAGRWRQTMQPWSSLAEGLFSITIISLLVINNLFFLFYRLS